MKIEAGQVAVITGGAAGIGAAIAKALSERGVKLVLGDTAFKANELEGEPVRVPCDVSKPADLEALRDAAMTTFGRVDLLFNNAGIYPGMQPVWMMDLDAWRQLYSINFWGVIHGIKAFVPQFIEQGRGWVINTASMSGLSTVPGSADYGSAKHAVIAVSETLRADLALARHDGIGVTVLCPSVVMTDMGKRALGIFAEEDTDDARKSIGSGPDLSATITPEDMAVAALQGIEAEHRYVLPTPRSRDRFLGRVQPILDAFDLYPVARGDRP